MSTKVIGKPWDQDTLEAAVARIEHALGWQQPGRRATPETIARIHAEQDGMRKARAILQEMLTPRFPRPKYEGD